MNTRLTGTKAKSGAALVAACAVCCAPLIAPPILAAFAAGGVGLAISGEVWCILALATAFGGYLLYRRHQIVRKKSADGACACPAEGGCNTGNSCSLPDGSA